MWDTGDMEKHSGSLGMTKSYFRDAHGVILIYERGREETKAELLTWAQLAKTESPACIFSIWCNNRVEEFGRGDHTRDFISTIESYYNIPPHLMFTYIPEGDIDSIHRNFNTLMSEVCSVTTTASIKDSIKLRQVVKNTAKTTCCFKNS